MASISKRHAIVQAMVDRLEAITVANGFRTDAGVTVIVGGVPQLGPDDPDDAIALLPLEDRVLFQGANLHIELPLEVVALTKADGDDLANAWARLEAVIADVKQAVELEDRTLGGLVPRMILRGSTRPVPREEGSLAMAAVVPYTAQFTEAWGGS